MSRKMIGLVACARRKLDVPAEARALYVSDLFRKASAYAERSYDAWYILSAKHGLLTPGALIEPYDLALADLTAAERGEWARRTFRQLAVALRGDLDGVTFHFHAGELYRERLALYLAEAGATVDVPLRGLEIGRQLAWYTERETPAEPVSPPPLTLRDTDRDLTIRQIRGDLARRSGKPWSVTGGRGTAWGWIRIDAPPRRQVDGYMSDADRIELGELLGLGRPAHHQGESVASGGDYYREYLDRAAGRTPSVKGVPYWD